jgi:hypothetical protein
MAVAVVVCSHSKGAVMGSLRASSEMPSAASIPFSRGFRTFYRRVPIAAPDVAFAFHGFSMGALPLSA